MAYQIGSALVTGASSGLGEAFADALAARGVSLLLAARSTDRLTQVGDRLTTQHHVRVERVSIDLAEPDAPQCLRAEADRLGFEPDLLVNNAGVGALGRFDEIPLERQLEMIHLNIEALVRLTGLYLPRMISRRSGAVINVSSAASLQPVPYYAVYGASKSFVLSFSEAIWAECRQRGVRVVAVCPGSVPGTRFAERAHKGAESPFRKLQQLPREAVVAAALNALERDAPAVVPGSGTKMVALIANVLPRRLQLLLTERMYRSRASADSR